MASRVSRSKKIKRPLKPERVVVAKPKKAIVSKPANKLPKTHKVNLKKIIIYIILVLVIIFAFMFLSWQYNETVNTINNSRQSTNTNINLNSQWQIISKVGNNENLLSDIENNPSLPEDSLSIILKSARLAKVKCLSNAELVADYNFVIKNVVYDKFILAESNCGGSTNIVFANLDTGWTVIHEGNNLIECNTVYSLNLPKGVAPYCQTKDVNYLNPNP